MDAPLNMMPGWFNWNLPLPDVKLFLFARRILRSAVDHQLVNNNRSPRRQLRIIAPTYHPMSVLGPSRLTLVFFRCCA